MSPSILQWLSLVGIIWLQSINGTNSDFSAYSSQLKHLLSISQVQLNNLAFASDAGKLFGWFSGVGAVHLPLWLVLMIGSVLGLIGYGVQYLFLVNQISSLSYWQLFVLCVLAGNSICWINTVCYMVTIRNFPSDRQVAVGLSTSYVGLSAKIYNDIVDCVSPSPPVKRAKAYLLLNSIVPMIASVITAPLVREIELGKAIEMKGGFMAMFVITTATGIYAVLGSTDSISTSFSSSIHAIAMGILLAAPIGIPIFTGFKESLEGKWWNKRENRIYNLSVDDQVGIGERVEIEVKEGEVVEEDGQLIRVKEEIGVKLMIRRVDFWLYFFVYMFGATLGLVFLNNLGQIAESRGYSKTSSLVSLSSSFGFFGRLIPSILNYFFSKSRYMVSRPASLAILMVPMAGAFFLLLNRTNLSLYISTAVIGVCASAITSIAVSTTSELFGTKNFSVNHNILVANIPIGSFLFGYLAALLYQREGDGQGRCMGTECYRKSFIIWGSVCTVGTILAFLLHVRTRKFYSQMIAS
ncbi:PREDICTED: protein NUCLEAR FUSION DEFECTIVE 4 [Nelumbo nucifera]|uniref:Protein NUCLEAR FUSION DEFECTIVE 4-like n=2 Tax=Nelumbo nucifera TaxID=4432 RepID=A0A822Y9Z0_NELNU|nr:PREDICTED: protein NUCLEAR FUSION DEFECTIVE 4 [Nelumbo nucifera]DAD26398.1 TPA_asm: hypothetical protein HUJ06_027866 [Nelumbo nucifera]